MHTRRAIALILAGIHGHERPDESGDDKCSDGEEDGSRRHGSARLQWSGRLETVLKTQATTSIAASVPESR
jgi:hypothetical protein